MIDEGGVVISLLEDDINIESAILTPIKVAEQNVNYETVATLYYRDSNNVAGTYVICVSKDSDSIDVETEIEEALKHIEDEKSPSNSLLSTNSTVTMTHIGTLSSSVVDQPKGKVLITYKVYTEQNLTNFDYYCVQATINATPGAMLSQSSYDYYTGNRLEFLLEPTDPNSAIVEEYDPVTSDSEGQYTVGLNWQLGEDFTLSANMSYTETIPGSSISATCDNRKTEWTVGINDTSRRTENITFKQ